MISTQLGAWLLEIDPKATRNFYAARPASTCVCRYCRNYRLACASLSPSVRDFFDSLGIDPFKEGQVFDLGPCSETARRYGGFYHATGRIEAGPEDCKAEWETLRLVELDNFRFGFSADLELVPEGFPRPVLQMEFEAELPWLLEEDPESDDED